MAKTAEGKTVLAHLLYEGCEIGATLASAQDEEQLRELFAEWRRNMGQRPFTRQQWVRALATGTLKIERCAGE